MPDTGTSTTTDTAAGDSAAPDVGTADMMTSPDTASATDITADHAID